MRPSARFLLLSLLPFTLAVAALPAATPRAAELRVVWSVLLVEPITGPPSAYARGQFPFPERTIVVPPVPVGSRLLLTSDPDRPWPLDADDELTCLFRSDGVAWTFDRDFGAPDGKTTIPFGPVDVTTDLAPGAYRVQCALTDLRPPLYSTDPIYLALLAPVLSTVAPVLTTVPTPTSVPSPSATPAASPASPAPTPTPTAIAPTATATPTSFPAPPATAAPPPDGGGIAPLRIVLLLGGAAALATVLMLVCLVVGRRGLFRFSAR